MLALSDLASQITLEVKSAVEHYEGHRFWFNESRVSLSCSSGATEYTLSTSTISVLAVKVTRNNASYAIEQIPEKQRLMYDSNNVTGDPSWYAIYGNKFIPYPAPSQTYTVGISCTRTSATLSVTTDSNIWTNNAQQLIESRAAATVCMRYLKDMEQAQAFKILEKDALYKLMRRESNKSAGRVIPTNF